MTNMTETDSDITRDDRDEIVITKGYKSITKGYKRKEGVIRDITRSYRDITRSYKRKEGVGTIGLD